MRERRKKASPSSFIKLNISGIIGPIITKSELISTIERVKRIANALTLESVITIKEGSLTEVTKNSLPLTALRHMKLSFFQKI